MAKSVNAVPSIGMNGKYARRVIDGAIMLKDARSIRRLCAGRFFLNRTAIVKEPLKNISVCKIAQTKLVLDARCCSVQSDW